MKNNGCVVENIRLNINVFFLLFCRKQIDIHDICCGFDCVIALISEPYYIVIRILSLMPDRFRDFVLIVTDKKEFKFIEIYCGK